MWIWEGEKRRGTTSDFSYVLKLLLALREQVIWASLVAQWLSCLSMQETQVQSLGWEDTLEKELATHFSILGKFHEQRRLAGYSPWSRKELDMTEQLNNNNR